MHADIIKEKLAELISSNEEWLDILNNTSPGHYGVENWDVTIYPNDVWLNIPERTFTFRQVEFSFELVLGGSNDGFNQDFSKLVNGNGTFRFTADNSDIEIEEMDLEMDLDLVSED